MGSKIVLILAVIHFFFHWKGQEFHSKDIMGIVIKKILVIWLIASLLNLYLPRVTFSQVGDIEDEITKHPPEMRSTPEEDIPVEKVKKRSPIPTWLWVGLGLLVVGATVAVVASERGGGGGGSSGSGRPTSAGGSVAVGW